ncbi:MAG: DUF2971 domain-containing protein [Desulfobaccales bacterium]
MRESEKILYHYTSLEGVLGITLSKSIWATNILYLNDASELNYSLDMLKEQVDEFKNDIPVDKNWLYKLNFFDKLIDKFNRLITNTKILGFFVCSFSEEKDLLSQWRGYCAKGIGFSLGFELSKLRKCARQKNCLIRPCNYDKKKQISAIRKLISELSSQFDAVIRNSSAVDQVNIDANELGLLAEFLIKFNEIAPTFKHPKFKEEKEWRIIVRRNFRSKGSIESIKFRTGPSMIVPYIEFPLPREEEDLIINKIIVGPTHDSILSKASIEMLLKSKNVRFNEVQESTIPYRNW